MRAKFNAYAKSVFSSWGQTKVVEDNFNKMRSREVSDTKNKARLPLTYWSMAREMGSIELHQRESVETSKDNLVHDIRARFSKDTFYTKNHAVSLAGAQGIIDTATWPTFSPQSAQFQYAVSEYLSILDAKADLVSDDEKEQIWDVASKCWRGVLFRKG